MAAPQARTKLLCSLVSLKMGGSLCCRGRVPFTSCVLSSGRETGIGFRWKPRRRCVSDPDSSCHTVLTPGKRWLLEEHRRRKNTGTAITLCSRVMVCAFSYRLLPRPKENASCLQWSRIWRSIEDGKLAEVLAVKPQDLPRKFAVSVAFGCSFCCGDSRGRLSFGRIGPRRCTVLRVARMESRRCSITCLG